MARSKTMFVARERQVWMRLRSHTAVFDRDPDFPKYRRDPSGMIVRILHLWLAEQGIGLPVLRHYVGSVRMADQRWMSRTELRRLFRRATCTARLTGEEEKAFRHRLSRFLRDRLRRRNRAAR